MKHLPTTSLKIFPRHRFRGNGAPAHHQPKTVQGVDLGVQGAPAHYYSEVISNRVKSACHFTIKKAAKCTI